MKSTKIGRYTQTQAVIAYIDGIVDRTIIDEIENRLKRIDINGVLESAYVEELIEDKPVSVYVAILTYHVFQKGESRFCSSDRMRVDSLPSACDVSGNAGSNPICFVPL